MKNCLYGALLMRRIIPPPRLCNPPLRSRGTTADNVWKWLGCRPHLGHFPAQSFRSGRTEERYVPSQPGQLTWTKREPAASNCCTLPCRARFIEQNFFVS